MENLSSKAVDEKVTEGKEGGIGIDKFLQGKVLFITGTTGFLGKVLVEKILRTSPNVSKMYLMIRAKNKEAAKHRLKTELLEAELFKCVKEKYGKNYESFLMSKLIPVMGNISQPDLGLEEELANAMKSDVQIIVNSAADISYYPRYDDGIDLNAMGPYHMMGFAKKCIQLELFLHVSSAYANAPRAGIIMEEKLSLTNSCIGREILLNSKSIGKKPIEIILENEKKLILDCKKNVEDIKLDVLSEELKELGSQRAREFGLPNAYTLSKAMGEMVIDAIREDISVVILRPSTVECTYQEPFPGWIQGLKTMSPVILSIGNGKLTGFPGDADNVVDIIPVDMVANATLAAMARHGLSKKPDINIYHVGSSVLNPVTLQDLFELFYQYFKSRPCFDADGKPINIQKTKIIPSTEEFHAHLMRELAMMNSADMNPLQKVESRKAMEFAKYMGKVYGPFLFSHYKFNCTNTQRLMESMCEEEKKKFGSDVKIIDWKHYITNVHIPGLRRHVIKEKGSSKL